MTQEDSLRIGLVGELTLQQGDRTLRLPPSRKTRALLAYLVLTGRPHRRERLCGLFWDVTDDPRGALRWSLSKLRGLVDDGDRLRIEADREHVRFEPAGCQVDALTLKEALSNPELAAQPVPVLEGWAAGFRGELLEGLDLPDFDDYQAWCIAEREQMRKLRASLLSTLTRVLEDTPERALPHARDWAQADPLDLDARLSLLRLSVAADRPDEATQHYESGLRMLRELGSDQVRPLQDAWRALQAGGGARERGGHASPPPAPAAAAATAATTTSTVDATPGRRPTPAGGATPAPPQLVGRDAEVQEIEHVLQQVRELRAAQVLLLSGEPGIGKTRLLQELMARARRAGARVLHGVAYESEAGRPYGPWIDGLRAVGRQPVSETLPVPDIEQAAPAEAGRERLFAGVAGWVGAITDEAPLLVVLDDVQWLDAPSAELLHYVARNNSSAPVLFVLGARGEELPDNGTLSRVMRSLRRTQMLQELQLLPLSPQAIGDVITPLGAAAETQLARIVAQSGGNPLFALELARGAAGDDAQLPASAADAVRDRIERLSPEALDVLRWGAVVGGAFDDTRLQALMALDAEAVVDALELLARHALVRRAETGSEGGEGYVFAHEVVRGAVYADLSQPRRELMHRRVARVLQEGGALDGELAAEIARHATLGQDHGLASEACLVAARRCLRLFAHEQGRKLARRGIRHAESLPDAERIARTIDLHQVLVERSRTEGADALRERLRQLAEQALDLDLPEHARRAFYMLSSIEWEGGALDVAREHTMAAMVAARGIDGPERVHGIAEAARCLMLLERDVPDAHAMLLEAEARARSLDMLPPSLSDGLGMVCRHHGRLAEAAEHFRRALDEARTRRERLLECEALEHLAMLHVEQADYEAAESTAGEMLRIAERLPEGSEVPMARTLTALSRCARGLETPDAMTAGLERLRAMDAKNRLTFCLCHAALLSLKTDDAEAARRQAQEALATAELLQRPSETLLARITLARACDALGKPQDAAAHRAVIDGRNWGDAAVPVRKRYADFFGAALPTGDHRSVEAQWS